MTNLYTIHFASLSKLLKIWLLGTDQGQKKLKSVARIKTEDSFMELEFQPNFKQRNEI